MYQEYKSKTNLFILIGIVAQIVGFKMGPGPGSIVWLTGVALFVTGCCYYAKGKGHNGAWGMFGLLSIFGLFILFCMRDKSKSQDSETQVSSQTSSKTSSHDWIWAFACVLIVVCVPFYDRLTLVFLFKKGKQVT